MGVLKTTMVRIAVLAVAALMLAAAYGAASAATVVVPVYGHYLVQAVVISVTPENGATQQDCASLYPAPGTQSLAIATLTSTTGINNAVIDVRGGVLATSGGYGYEQSVFRPASGSTFTNQSGNAVLTTNGDAIGAFPYTATVTVLDTQSFVVTVSLTLTDFLGNGTCVEVQQAAFTHSANQ
jgi:hypothetical protein